MTNEMFMLSEKYRPTKRQDLIGNKLQWKTFFALVDETTKLKEVEETDRTGKTKIVKKRQAVKPILLYGFTGVGKTTAIGIAKSHLEKKYKSINYMETNASDMSGKEAIQKIVIPFLKPAGRTVFNERKVMFMDEFNLTPQAQETMKTPLEKTDAIVFASTNIDPFSAKFDRAFRGRYNIIRLDPVEAKDIFKRLEYICKEEDYEYEKEALQYLSKECEGSVREAIDDMYAQWVAHKKIKLEYLSASEKYFERINIDLSTLILGDYEQGRDNSFAMIKETGLTAREYIKQATEVVVRHKMLPSLFKARVSGELARTEFQIVIGGDVGTQLTGLFGQIVSICDPIAKKVNKK